MIDILLKVSLISTHLAITLEGHLEQVLHIFGYLNIHKKIILLFDCSYPIIIYNIFNEYSWFYLYRYAKEAIPPNMSEAMGHEVFNSIFYLF